MGFEQTNTHRAKLSACILFIFLATAFAGKTDAIPPAAAGSAHPFAPTWVFDQTIYEVNLRQFSPTGDVEGLRKQLPRLSALGVGTLWIMPINPIGIEGHSGKLGSPYAVRDYKKFNPEFGTVEQFKSMIDEAHRMGMFVIIDWVANHSALDNDWVKQHPDWYKHDAAGALVHPMAEWKDVAGLNYDNRDLRHAMIDAMTYWVRDVGVDGFRFDTAEWTPLDFWCEAREALRAIKPIFMLAEGDKPELMNQAFDCAYAWNLPTNDEGIVKGKKNVADLCNFIKAEQQLVPARGFRLNFTSNHDKNTWEGTTKEQLGDAAPAFTVLTFTLPGLPLIYNGQEAGLANEHRLDFFNHDPIVWKQDPAADLYRTLAMLKRNHPALWTGARTAPVQFIESGTKDSLLAFSRSASDDKVLVILNLSAQPVELPALIEIKNLKPILGGDSSGTIKLAAWGYRVWATQ